jgi:hypothetical protein
MAPCNDTENNASVLYIYIADNAALLLKKTKIKERVPYD